MKKHFNLFLYLFICIPTICLAEIKVYRPVVATGPNIGIKFQVPYSLGTHEGIAHIISGSIAIDKNDPSLATGEFRVPIESITTNKAERDCHMQESLGLNYQVSDFPAEHVCDNQFHLALTGKNSVVYPQIILKILSINSLDMTKKILLEGETPIEVVGVWTIHGKSNQVKFPMKIIAEGDKMRISGDVPILLSSYDIKVKPARLAFFTINVKDQVKVFFDFLLTPEPL
ncbi:MAG: YceI family protein [Bacteriovorax sp.]|nr:YceI family protein [Bacteriovorax sp.]